ncbi:MAG: mannose-1-phosphate guanylyltransferase [Anaerolineae bacterium]
MAFYALILAGGGGTRLWPLSRRNRPKQTLPLVGDTTMFQMSVERLLPLFALEHIFVVTGQDHLAALRAQCPEIPAGNFIVEPTGRDTGPAAGLGALHLYSRDADAIVAVLTTDHYIGAPARFREALQVARSLAERRHLVALGIMPSFPASGYAYLERGAKIDEIEGFACYRAVGFREKPDPATAAEFLLSGRYCWNSGMLVSRAEQMLDEIQRHEPALGRALSHLAEIGAGAEFGAELRRLWPQVPKNSIDQVIMSGAQELVVLTADIGWSDVGSWNTLYEVLRRADEENVAQGSAPVLQLRTRGTLVLSNRMVVTIGVEDLVIVDTDDVLLICRRDQSEDVRQIVNILKEGGHDTYL